MSFIRSFIACGLLLAALLLAAQSSGPQKVNARPDRNLESPRPNPSLTTTTSTEEPVPITEAPVERQEPQTTQPAPVQSVAPMPGPCGQDFECFKACTIAIESGGNYATNTGNGHFGAFQFNQQTWDGAVARAGYPEWVGRPASEAPPSVQDAAARQLWSERGTQPWGGRCS